MASFSFGLLIVVIITICVLALVKRYVYPIKADKWRRSTGLSKSLANLYDWCDGRGTVKRRHCTDFIEDEEIYRVDE